MAEQRTAKERGVIWRLHEKIANLQAALNHSELLQMKWLLKIGRLEARIAELELQSDDAKGVRCPSCGEPMVSCSTMNIRVCGHCDSEWEWTLKPGQLPLVGNNRQGRQPPP